MLQKNPWVISMDCTYKTNWYGLPLLDIVGFAVTGLIFYLGFAFMRDEKDDLYKVGIIYMILILQDDPDTN